MVELLICLVVEFDVGECCGEIRVVVSLYGFELDGF